MISGRKKGILVKVDMLCLRCLPPPPPLLPHFVAVADAAAACTVAAAADATRGQERQPQLMVMHLTAPHKQQQVAGMQACKHCIALSLAPLSSESCELSHSLTDSHTHIHTTRKHEEKRGEERSGIETVNGKRRETSDERRR